MSHWFTHCFAIIVLIVATQADAASGAVTDSDAVATGNQGAVADSDAAAPGEKGAARSDAAAPGEKGALAGPGAAAKGKKGAAPSPFDSVWFYRDGIRVVPEIGKRWITVVFNSSDSSKINDLDSTTVNGLDSGDASLIQQKAKAIIKSHGSLVEYLYDANLAEDACFFRMRDGLSPQDTSLLITQLKRNKGVKYVHPTLVLDNKTFAYFNTFEMEWKTGTDKAQRESLLRASHAALDDGDQKEQRFTVDVKSIPYFKALNLLSEDIKVLRVTPYLVEVKPSIRAKVALAMSGGNIGDSIPFTLSIAFSDRVSIDPSSLATLDLRPSEIQKDLFDCSFDPYDYAKAVTKSPITITGRVRFYAPGEFSLPAVKISYSCPTCSNSTVRSLETEPVLFKVSSMIPEDQSQYRLMVPTDSVPPDFRLAALHRQSQRYLGLVAVICGAGIILCAAWLFLVLRRIIRARRHRLSEREKDTLLDEQLRVLLQRTPSDPHWNYLGEVGALLRKYLVVFCGGDPRYQGGSGRQFMETIGSHLPPESVDSLSSIFATIDNNVSLESEHCQDIDQLCRDILKIVDLTARDGAAHG